MGGCAIGQPLSLGYHLVITIQVLFRTELRGALQEVNIFVFPAVFYLLLVYYYFLYREREVFIIFVEVSVQSAAQKCRVMLSRSILRVMY